jgi:GT2 family glycosyltransferase
MATKADTVCAPKVAVLVLNYNGKHHLFECFSSLKEQTYKNYDVYLLDNRSVDGSVEYTKRIFPWVKIISFKDNLGFSKAYNQAIKSIDMGFVAILNNDTRVDRNWLQELVNSILEDNLIAAVGSKLLLMDRPYLLHNAGSKITPVGSGFDIGLYEKDSEKYNVKKEVGAVCGAAMLVRKDVFLRIGGFDEDFFAYFEDVDFCWRAWIFGYKVLYVPTSVVYHKLGGSFGSLSRETAFLCERNRLFTILKNFERLNLLKALLLSVPYNLAKIIPYNCKVQEKNRLFIIILKANLYVLRNIRIPLGKRRVINKNRVVNDKILYKRNIIASIRQGLQEFHKFN